MQTIKLPYTSDSNLLNLLKQYSSVVRFAYNRFLENKSEKDIRLLTKELNNIELLNSWLTQCAIRDAKAIQERFQEQKVIFGGKYLFKQRLQNKISKEAFEIKRLSTLTSQGEMQYLGNRLFKLDITNQQIKFVINHRKRNKQNQQFILHLPHLRKSYRQQLLQLEELCKTGTQSFTVKLTTTHICISFEPIKQEIQNLIDSRYIGIDLNPVRIGMSVVYDDEVVEVKQYETSCIIDEFRHKKLASSSYEAKYYQNKLVHETYEIAKKIAAIAAHHKCKYVFIEQLQFQQQVSSKHAGERRFNRYTKNLWKKTSFIQNLSKRLKQMGIKLLEVGAAYTSVIGNFKYEYSDACNASIEIARRGYELRVLKKKNRYYPPLEVKHLWKEMATSCKTWKELFSKAKNLKLSYRVSLDEAMHLFNVFEMNHTVRSKVLVYSSSQKCLI